MSGRHQPRACDDCGRKPEPGSGWRARKRECDGMRYCPDCRPNHPATKAEHRCGSCDTIKPIGEFYLKHGRPNGVCKACILDRHRLEKYGITPAQLADMLERQGGLCAICRCEMPVPYVDHCHTSLHVRGALCNECNTGLGMFNDDADRMIRAADYLRGSLA